MWGPMPREPPVTTAVAPPRSNRAITASPRPGTSRSPDEWGSHDVTDRRPGKRSAWSGACARPARIAPHGGPHGQPPGRWRLHVGHAPGLLISRREAVIVRALAWAIEGGS